MLSLFGEPFRESAEEVRALFELGLMYWPVFIMAYSIFSIVVVSLIGWFVLAGVLERLSGIPRRPQTGCDGRRRGWADRPFPFASSMCGSGIRTPTMTPCAR